MTDQVLTNQPTRAQTAARVVLAALLTGLGLWTLREFIPALVWAGILAIAVWPFYQRTQRQIGRASCRERV